MREIKLKGCAPVPLAAYLKALGVFRLLAEQKDSHIQGCWRDEAFVIKTAFSVEEVICFFLDNYRPSPIISPWNGGSGFYYREGKTGDKDPVTGNRIKTGVRDEATVATKTLDLIAQAEASRFRPLRDAINQARYILKELGYEQAPADEQKLDFVALLRRSLRDIDLDWLDAALALSTEDLDKPPLLGTGGNDGNLDFSSNYMQRLIELFDTAEGTASADTKRSLQGSLLGTSTTSLRKGAIGQFSPGAAGGPNATVGFESDALVNPWDYVLMLEGALLFSSCVARRLHSANSVGLSYPFTVNSTNTDGTGGSLVDEKRKSKGKVVGNSYEIWMPLWEEFAHLSEIRSLLLEGRAIVHRKPARDGLEFARAVASLGVNRGISAFARYAFLQRRGDSISATPKGRIRVEARPRARLLNDLDAGNWLSRFRRYARTLDRQGRDFVAPQRLQSLALRLDEAIFVMTQDKTPQAAQGVLSTVGEVAAYLASSPKARHPDGGNLNPPPCLSRCWFEAANDDTAEFRIASALAGLGRRAQIDDEAADGQEYTDGDTGAREVEEAYSQDKDASKMSAGTSPSPGNERAKKISPPPFRAHLAPLAEKSWYGRYHEWGDDDRLAVWGADSLERNLISVLERRLLFSTQRNLIGSPFTACGGADLASVLAFLAGETDDVKIAALARGLAWAEPPNFMRGERAQTRPMPLAYALMKPFFAPVEQLQELGVLRDGAALPVPTGFVQRLRSEDVGAAVGLACRRAYASGLPVAFEPSSKHVAHVDGPRLLASLLIPIRVADLKRALERAYPALFDNRETLDSKEGPANAA